MTLLGKLSCLFPLTHALIMLWSAYQVLHQFSLFSVLLLIASVYFLPPLLFRLYALKYPIRPGRWILERSVHSNWWIAHQLQMMYAVIPAFEGLLRLIPGAYSAWLRLWGSHVGKRVYWTVSTEILDRHFMEIGDDVIFGHRVICSAHLIRKNRKGDLVLFLKRIKIGNTVFVGALSRLGPGARIPSQTVIPYNTEHWFPYAP